MSVNRNNVFAIDLCSGGFDFILLFLAQMFGHDWESAGFSHHSGLSKSFSSSTRINDFGEF